MKLEDFNSMTDEEKAAYLNAADSNAKTLENVTAERDSFKNENDKLLEQVNTNAQELKATKELNYTLARKINVEPVKDIEEVIHDFIKGEHR